MSAGRACGSLGLLKPHHLEIARRCHKPTSRYAGRLPRWALCFLPVHNRDQEHVGSLRELPAEFGGGFIVVTWGRDPMKRIGFHQARRPQAGSTLNLTPPLLEVRGIAVPPARFPGKGG